MPVQPHVAAIAAVPLASALASIARVFDTTQMADRAIALDDVVEYYRQSDRGYRLFHSTEGALHIALGCDGHDDTSCFARQAQLFVQHLDAVQATDAIEFGCGMGYNTRWVADARPELQVLGVDLTPQHIDWCRKHVANRKHLRYEQANYEQLAHDADSCDGVLAVETLCQTTHMQRALAEAYRVLRPGGRLVVVDCFRSAPFADFTPNEQQAALLVEKATAVDAFSVIGEWLELCRSIGFEVVQATDHSAETSQNLRRLHGLASKFFALPRVLTSMAKVFPPRLLENAACGLLMPYTVGCGVHVYYSAVLAKPQPV